jgi:hypothetical protein
MNVVRCPDAGRAAPYASTDRYSHRARNPTRVTLRSHTWGFEGRPLGRLHRQPHLANRLKLTQGTKRRRDRETLAGDRRRIAWWMVTPVDHRLTLRWLAISVAHRLGEPRREAPARRDTDCGLARLSTPPTTPTTTPAPTFLVLIPNTNHVLEHAMVRRHSHALRARDPPSTTSRHDIAPRHRATTSRHDIAPRHGDPTSRDRRARESRDPGSSCRRRR